MVLEIGEIIGDIGELCAHIGIRYQRPKSREASGFTPKLFLPSAFYISLSDHMQLVFFHRQNKNVESNVATFQTIPK